MCEKLAQYDKYGFNEKTQISYLQKIILYW